MKRILVVSFIFPYPPNSGGGRDIYERLKALRQAGYTIDLVATVRETPEPKDVAVLESMVEKLWIVPRSRSPKTLLSLKPFHHESRSGIKSVPLTNEYDVVLIEGDLVGGILENPLLRAKHVVLRVHNDEAHLHRSLAIDASGIGEKFLFQMESYKFKRYSPWLMKQCDQLWFISDIELQKTRGTELQAKSSHVPTLVDQSTFKHPELLSSKVLYAGALSIPINYNGLIWYLKNVHPQLLSTPGYEFVLAGKTGSASIDKLLAVVHASERVTFCPDLADLGPLYAAAGAFINPILNGAGVKIKTIDAATSGLPVVTTSVGGEGTGFIHGVHAIIADTPEEFANGVRRLLSDKPYSHSLVKAAQSLLVKSNGPEVVTRLLQSLT